MPTPFPPTYNSMQAQAGLTPMGGVQMPPIMFPMGMQPPAAPHPGQVAAMLQQQAMAAQYSPAMPSGQFGTTTLGMPGMFGPSLPPPLYGHSNRARQAGVQSSARDLATLQGGVGVGARMAGYAMASSVVPFGGLLYEGLGIGQGVQNLSNAMFAPMIQQRERALALQNASTGYVVGGGMLSQTGQGMNALAAQQVTSGIGRMADSPAFQRATGNMFNRADLDRITRLSGELGMLDNAQSADQMLREVRRVSKAVSNFMKVIEEPDLQKAMQQMGKLRNLGFGMNEMPTAAANARTFARMAGVSMDQAMETATQQSGIFRAAGLSGAAGFQASLGAQGMARQLGGLLDPRQLNMAGGVEGIQGTLMQGAASAATNTPFMMAMLTRGQGGALSIDSTRLQSLLSGRMSLSDVMRQAGSNMRGLGGRAALEEMFTRQNELNDQMSSMLGPQGQMLMPLLQARMIQRQTGGSLGSALRTMGMDEQQARTYEQMGQSPEFFTNMRRQMQISMRERAVAQRDQLAERGTLRSRFGRLMHHGVGRHLEAAGSALMDPMQEWLAETQEREEALGLQGSGPARIIGPNRMDSEVFRAGTRELLTARGPEGQAFRERMAEAGRAAARGSHAENQRDALYQQIPFVRMLHGPGGWGLSREGRGGDTYRSTVIEGAGLGTRIADSVGLGFAPGAREVERLGREQEALTSIIEESQRGSTQDQIARDTRARQTFGTGPGARQRADRARSAATVAMQEYVRSQSSLGGLIRTGEATMSGMQSAIRQRLASQGYDEQSITAALADRDFMAGAMQDVRGGLGESDQQVLDEIAQQGGNAREAAAGQTTSQLRSQIEERRGSFMEKLGLDRFRNTSAEGVRSVADMLNRGDPDSQELRERLFTAVIMSKNTRDPAERQRGLDEIRRLEERFGEQKVREMRATMERQIGATLEEGDVEDIQHAMSQQGSFEERVALAHSAAQEGEQMMAAEAEGAQRSVLGTASADYGANRDVQSLRRNAHKVRDAGIRRMLEGNASDEEINRAIDQATSRAIGADAGISATGTDASAADREAAANVDGMINVITAGMEEFPTAVTELNQAATALQRSARDLQDVADGLRISTGLGRAN